MVEIFVRAKITIKEADEYQTDLLTEILNFRKKYEAKESRKKKQENKIVFKNLYNFFEVGEKT